MKIITLCGFKQSGKSTVSEIIKGLNENLKIKEVSFAGFLKDVCSNVFSVPRSHFDDQNYKEVPFNNPVLFTKENAREILEQYKMSERVGQVSIANAILGAEGSFQTPREIAQKIGTNFLRDLRPDIHCDVLKELIFNDKDRADLYIIADCRFENELTYFQSFGEFNAYFIHRLEAYNSFIKELESGKSHPSETETLKLIPKCKIINNNSSLEDLINEIVKKVV